MKMSVPRSVKIYLAGVLVCTGVQAGAMLIIGAEAAPSLLEQLGLSLIVPGVFVLGMFAFDDPDC